MQRGSFSEKWCIERCFYCCFFSFTFSLVRSADAAGGTDIRSSSANWGVCWGSKIETLFGCLILILFFSDECRSDFVVNDANINLVVLNDLDRGNNLVDIDVEFYDRTLQRFWSVKDHGTKSELK